MMTKQQIVFCSNYQQELEKLNLQAVYNDLQVAYFPSRCGMPPVEWSALKNELLGETNYESLHVVSCGSIKGLPAEQRITDRHYSNNRKQCFLLITNPDLAECYIQKGYYLVTPGWLKQWRDILDRWGFDQHTARAFFKEAAQAIMLLDTGVDPKAESNLTEFALYVDRPSEIITVGLDYLELLLRNTVLKSRIEAASSFEKENLAASRKELADFVMALDLLNSLARVRQEDLVLESIREMFTMLFAPQEIIFRPADQVGPVSHPTSYGDGFVVPVNGSGGLLGEIEVKGLNQPQYLEQYMKIAARIVNICGLTIENARHYQRIKDLSDTDGLTGISNRRKLEEHLTNEWRRMQREERPLALLMCDIDYFKSYNDLYGHQAGDDCLRAVAKVLDDHCRRGGDLAARFGGEEFTVVLPSVTLKGAGQLAEEIRQSTGALKLKHEGSSVSKYITLSIGAASIVPSAESSKEELMALADKALYTAKSAGRNRVVLA